MSRQRLIGRLAVVLVCCCVPGVAVSEDPPAPWSGVSSDPEATVADWAAGAFSPAPKAEEEPAPAAAAAAAEAPPVAGRYGAPAERRRPIDRPEPQPLAAGNPLRGGGESPTPPPQTESRNDLRGAPPAAFTPPPEKIAIGATPIPRAPAEDTVRIPVEAFAEPAPEAPATRASSLPFESTPDGPAPREPIRVASVADDTGEPARFAADYRAATPAPEPVPSEGVGQPGPPELEGPQRASLVVEKRAPTEVRIGQPATFAIRVRNTGDAPAEDVVLTDPVPAGARLVGSQPTAQQDNGRLVWRLGVIPPGDDRTVEVRLEPTREGPLGSVATVTMGASASASTTCTRPALALRVASAQRVKVGEVQPVTIEVHNPGTGTATGVMLLGDVPPQVTHPAGRELEFEVGSLAAGETRRIDLNLTAQAAGRVAGPIRVVGDGGLSAEQPLDFEVIAPSLAVSIDGPSRRYLERPASYTIGVDNPGTAPARDVRLVTHLPRGMEFVRANNLGEYDATTHSVYWSLAELPEGERGEVEVVAMPVAAGEHTLSVQSESADGLRAEHTHRVAVDGVASLAFEVRDLADPIEVGAETVYEIRVLNEGTKAATGVRVRVEAPRGMRLLAADGQTPGRVGPGGAEFAPLATLEPGQKAAYRVRVAGAEPGDQRVAVLVESDELSRPIRREESTRVFGDE